MTKESLVRFSDQLQYMNQGKRYNLNILVFSSEINSYIGDVSILSKSSFVGNSVCKNNEPNFFREIFS